MHHIMTLVFNFIIFLISRKDSIFVHLQLDKFMNFLANISVSFKKEQNKKYGWREFRERSDSELHYSTICQTVL